MNLLYPKSFRTLGPSFFVTHLLFSSRRSIGCGVACQWADVAEKAVWAETSGSGCDRGGPSCRGHLAPRTLLRWTPSPAESLAVRLGRDSARIAGRASTRNDGISGRGANENGFSVWRKSILGPAGFLGKVPELWVLHPPDRQGQLQVCRYAVPALASRCLSGPRPLPACRDTSRPPPAAQEAQLRGSVVLDLGRHILASGGAHEGAPSAAAFG